MNRITIGKTVGLIFGGVAFFLLPLVFIEIDILFRVAIWFWYISLGAIIGLFGIMDRYVIFNFSIPFWLRGVFLGAWMNFVLVIFLYNDLVILMQGSYFEGYSPFLIIVEGMIFGLIVDFLATKFVGEGSELLK
ncbi:MAG: hypothetical protein QM490_05470 [Candidatus Gracilibacteria bacterium]